MILFLDYDGVLHPDEVYWSRRRGIYIRTDKLPPEYREATLFCYMLHLEELLHDFPEVRIVLSTSWVKEIGFSRSLKRLSPALQERVIGATFHSQHTPHWGMSTRFLQILDHVERHRLGENWVAVDNDAVGWPVEKRGRLIHTDDNRGISDLTALTALRQKLNELRQGR